MAKRILSRKWLFGIATLIGAIALGLFTLDRALRYQPPFYQQVLELDSSVLETGGDDLERQVFHARNQIERSQPWEISLTEDQINGWLAVDLIEKFSDLLPPEASDPRIAIDSEHLHLACTYRYGSRTSVLHLRAQVFLTEQANTVAIRIDYAKAGRVNLPMKRLMEEVSEAAQRGNLQLRWTQQEGDPTAILTLARHLSSEEEVHQLQTVRTEEGQLILAGRVVPTAP